jgi:hypothetical protein
MPGIWDPLQVAMRCQAEACIQAGGGHMEHLLKGNVKSSVSQTDLKNSETMHFQTYVDINYFYYLHMRNSFLKLCHVFVKHPAFCEY